MRHWTTAADRTGANLITPDQARDRIRAAWSLRDARQLELCYLEIDRTCRRLDRRTSHYRELVLLYQAARLFRNAAEQRSSDFELSTTFEANALRAWGRSCEVRS